VFRRRFPVIYTENLDLVCCICKKVIKKLIFEVLTPFEISSSTEDIVEPFRKLPLGIIKKGSPEDGFVSIDLCKSCFNKFMDRVNEISKKLERYISDFKIPRNEKLKIVLFTRIDRMFEWLDSNAESISEPREDFVEINNFVYFGIGFYIKPKNPMENYIKGLLPYGIIIRELMGREV